MSTILSHPAYTKTQKNLERTVVRDKLMRIVQYFSRFAAWYAYRKGFSREAIARWKSVQKNFSLARKLFRIGKPMNNFKAIVAELTGSGNPDKVLHLTTLFKNLGTFGFLALDPLVWANTTGIYKFSPQVAVFSNRFWVLGLAAAAIEGVYLTRKAVAKINALEAESEKDADSLKLARAEKSKALIAFVWNALDLSIPLTALGYTGFSDGTVGLAGTITSYIGLQQAW